LNLPEAPDDLVDRKLSIDGGLRNGRGNDADFFSFERADFPLVADLMERPLTADSWSPDRALPKTNGPEMTGRAFPCSFLSEPANHPNRQSDLPLGESGIVDVVGE
jgi:hypothetical protein